MEPVFSCLLPFLPQWAGLWFCFWLVAPHCGHRVYCYLLLFGSFLIVICLTHRQSIQRFLLFLTQTWCFGTVGRHNTKQWQLQHFSPHFGFVLQEHTLCCLVCLVLQLKPRYVNMNTCTIYASPLWTRSGIILTNRGLFREYKSTYCQPDPVSVSVPWNSKQKSITKQHLG